MSKNSTIVRAMKLATSGTSRVAPPLAAMWLEHLFLSPTPRPRPLREVEWLEGARRLAVPFEGSGHLPLYRWGHGPRVLLVHGWAGRGTQLAAFAAPLVEAGLEVIAFDAPAHGEAQGRQTNLPEMARAVEAVAEAVGPIYAIIAHSLGTAATSLALSRGLSVERLIYLAPPENPGEYLHRAAGWLGFTKRVGRMTQSRVEARFGLPFEQVKASELAPQQQVPLQIFHDLEDRDVPWVEGRRLQRLWPGARLFTTRGLGHRRLLRDEGVIAQGVAFLSGQPLEADLGGGLMVSHPPEA